MFQTLMNRSQDIECNGDHRDGPMHWIAPGVRPTPVSYLVQDFIEEGVATVLAGRMGSAKSLHALLIGMQVSTGATIFGRCSKKRAVAFLDYEDEFNTHLGRAALLRKGHPEIAEARLLYRRCYLPLHEELAEIKQMMIDHSISVLIVDSLAMAAGAGDLQGAEAPRTLQRALRELPHHTALFVAHPPKDASTSAVAGSGFFQNLPRTIIEQQVTDGEGTNCLTARLVHLKSNHGRLRDKAGFRIHFSPEAIQFETWTAILQSQGGATMSLTERIKDALLEGPKTVRQLAEELGVSETQVRSRLNDGKQCGLFMKFPGGQWGLIYKPAAV